MRSNLESKKSKIMYAFTQSAAICQHSVFVNSIKDYIKYPLKEKKKNRSKIMTVDPLKRDTLK